MVFPTDPRVEKASFVPSLCSRCVEVGLLFVFSSLPLFTGFSPKRVIIFIQFRKEGEVFSHCVRKRGFFHTRIGWEKHEFLAPSWLNSRSCEAIEAIDALVKNWHGQGNVDLPGFIQATRVDGSLRFVASKH